jgi:hypothetical protein
MKPRSTVTALLAVTASLLASKAEAGRVKRMTSPAGSAVSSPVTTASALKSGRKTLVVRLKALPSS